MPELDINWHTQLAPFAVKALHDYCAGRHSCKGCRYRPGMIGGDPLGVACCIFANPPCEWPIENDADNTF